MLGSGYHPSVTCRRLNQSVVADPGNVNGADARRGLEMQGSLLSRARGTGAADEFAAEVRTGQDKVCLEARFLYIAVLMSKQNVLFVEKEPEEWTFEMRFVSVGK